MNMINMPKPALSLEFNPIEHLWDEIHRKLNDSHPRPVTAVEIQAYFLI